MGSLLNTIFIVCLVLTVVFFVITLILFFLFDIRTIFNIRTGKAAAKTVKEMETANANTGRLRVGKVTNTGTLGKKQDKSKKLKTKTQTFGIPQQPAAPQQHGPITEDITSRPATPENLTDDQPTDVLSAETELLSQPDDYSSQETQLLERNEPDASAETMLLTEQMRQPDPAAPVTIENNETLAGDDGYDDVRFDIVKMIILCDTDEVLS